MATKTLVIRITGDNTEHKRAIQESIAAQAKLDTKSGELNDRMKAGAKSAGEAAIASARSAADGQVREANRAAEGQFAAMGKSHSAHLKFVDQQAKGAKKLADAQAKEAARASKAQVSGFKASEIAAGQFKDVLGGVLGQFTLMNIGSTVVTAIAQSFRNAREQAEEGVKFVNEYRDALLEIAALKGNLGSVTGELKDQVVFRSKTLQSANDAKAFQAEYLNVGQVNTGQTVSEADSKAVMVEAAKFQSAEGGDAATHARLAAAAPSLMGKKPGGGMWTKDEIMAHHKATFNQMQFGGFSFSSGAKQLFNSQGLLASGGFKDDREMTGMLTALSNVGDPATAETSLRQLDTALVGSAKRLKGPHVDGESMKQADYYKSIGYKDGMTNNEMMKLVHADLVDQEKKDPKFQVSRYLQGKGYGNAESINAIAMAHRSMTLGQWDEHMQRANNATGTNAGDENRPGFIGYDQRMTNFQHSQLATDRRRSVGADATKANVGLPVGYYSGYAELAFDALVGQKKASGKFDDWKNDYMFGGNIKLDSQMLDAAASEAKRVGMPVKQTGIRRWEINGKEVSADRMAGMKDPEKAEYLQGIIQPIEAAGGNVSDELLRRSIEVLERIADATEKQEKAMSPQGRPPAPAPVNKAPRVLPAKPGPGNLRPSP